MKKSLELAQQVLQDRDYLNSIPEIGWQEIKTTQFILQSLQSESLIPGLGENQTGALLEVGKGSQSIFIRADIDALNTSDGPQHLCGHSTHTAAAMGAFRWLKEQENALNQQGKKVQFLFQPAEEVHPSGARAFLAAFPEALSQTKFGFAVHIEPRLPVGRIAIPEKAAWAAHDSVKITVTGKEAHVKNTSQAIDALEGQAWIVLLTKEFQKQFPEFGQEIVFNFNTAKAGVANNTVAGSAFLTGAVRWTNPNLQAQVKEFVTHLPDQLASMFGGQISVSYVENAVPLCQNDEQLVAEIGRYFEDHSNFAVFSQGLIELGVEDFAHFSQAYRALYAKIGIDSPFDLHDPSLRVSDEGTLAVLNYWQTLLEWWLQY